VTPSIHVDADDLLRWARYLETIPRKTRPAVARALNVAGEGIVNGVVRYFVDKNDWPSDVVRNMIIVKEATPENWTWSMDATELSPQSYEWSRPWEARDKGDFDKQALVKIITSGDESVCPVCTDAAEHSPYTMEEIAALQAKWANYVPDEGIIASSFRSNLLHPNCILPGMMVEGDVVAALRSKYVGEAVEIVSRIGTKLTVTPNHPVFTAGGLVVAGSIREGMKLLANTNDVRVSPRVNSNKAPVLVENVFAAFEHEGSVLVAASVDDLHGDAKFVNGYVNVVFSDRRLLRHVVTELTKTLGYRFFVTPGVQQFFVAGLGPSELRRERVVLTASTFMRAGNLLRFRSLGHLGPFDTLRLGSAADLDVVVNKEIAQSHADYAKFLSELVLGSAGHIQLDDVIGVRRFKYAGHVYDLQAATGWVIADNVVISNCRCIVQSWEMTRRLPVTFGDQAGAPPELFTVRQLGEAVAHELSVVVKAT